jgi:ribonuclease G
MAPVAKPASNGVERKGDDSMGEDILINVNDFETRVALLRGGQLQEIHLQRSSGPSVTGNIYRGRVVRILPGMQAAFVDIGLKRPGFLHARDIHAPLIFTADAERGEEERRDEDGDSRAGEEPVRDIRELIHDGQSVIVQVSKDPIASKGARLTSHLALASRFLVLMPFSSHVGVSQRIEDECERDRLRKLAEQIRRVLEVCGGLIVRTAAEGVADPEMAADLRYLLRVWERVEADIASGEPRTLLYEDLPLHTRVLRDLVGQNVQSIKIDAPSTYGRVQSFIERFMPEYIQRVELYDDAQPLFDRFNVEEEIARALSQRVALKSGGDLVIEQTEAMITIDVNTGGYVGSRNLEETVYRTNLEAANMIPRQLRLRNLGGIVVIDFIDMEDLEHRRQVLRALEKACEHDPARIRISGLSSLGLVEMSRKRTRESLVQQLCEPCDECGGHGVLKTAESMCFEVFRAILRDANNRSASQETTEYLVRASEAVVDRLLDENAATVRSLSEQVGKPIRFQVEPMYTQEQFDVVLMQDLHR